VKNQMNFSSNHLKFKDETTQRFMFEKVTSPLENKQYSVKRVIFFVSFFSRERGFVGPCAVKYQRYSVDDGFFFNIDERIFFF